MTEQVDSLCNVQKRKIEELQLKTEGLRYAVIALGTIIALHILYHVAMSFAGL